jgi:hypothetical protein
MQQGSQLHFVRAGAWAKIQKKNELLRTVDAQEIVVEEYEELPRSKS